MRGTHPKQIRRKLDGAFSEFEGARAELIERSKRGEKISRIDSAFVAARLYAKILKVHPFVDGNLRAAYLTLEAALMRLGLPSVEFPDLDAHNAALIQALEPGGRRQSYEPLAELIAGLIPAK